MAESGKPVSASAGGRWHQHPILFRQALLDDVLPFWFPRCVDEVHGGFLTGFDRDGTLVDSDKSVWAQGRMAWLLLTLYHRIEARAEWKAWAERGLDFLNRHCLDSDGRLFFHMTQEGEPIRKRRYAYSEAFASIASAAHYAATQEGESADRALQWFRRFTQWHFTPGLMPSKFLGTRPVEGLGPYMIAIVTGQELRRYLGNQDEVQGWIDRCIETIASRFVKEDERVVMETVGESGQILDHFDGRLLNPGHAIEAAWFIMEEGQFQRDDDLIKLGIRMVDWMWERGWDKEWGGLFYYRDVWGKPIQEYWHEMKFWWPHNEAMIATLMAARLDSDSSRWLGRFHAVCDWSFEHFGDPDYGEWFGYLRRDGTVSSPLKGGLWKSCFHLPRALLRCWELLADDPGQGPGKPGDGSARVVIPVTLS